MAAVALVSVALSTYLVNSGLESEFRKASRDRLQAAAQHLSALASDLKESGASPKQINAELDHVAAIENLAVTVSGSDDATKSGRATARGQAGASAPIVTNGRTTGTLTAVPVDRAEFEAPDRATYSRLNRSHILAGVIAGALALLAALLLAAPLTRPIRRLTAGARKMEHGELEVRVDPGGGPELEALARALNALAATLEHEETLRRDAAADLAHELRTPVTGLLSRIEAAQDDVMDDRAANLSAMHSEAIRLALLTEDLARLTDAQKPGLMIEHLQIDLADVAARCAEEFEDRFAEEGIELELDLRAAPATGDSGRLEQLLENLLSNALRYTDSGGMVTVFTFTEEEQSVLRVADTGMGIAPEEVGLIFDRFWRSEKSRSRIHGGAGIGLAIVSELARAHGAEIVVESSLGSGTTFSVQFPLGKSRDI
jgi:signal transduction histidine kinase